MHEIKFAEYSKIKLQTRCHCHASLVHKVKRPWHLEAYCEGHGSYWWLCGCPSFMEIDVRTGQTDTAIFYNLKYKPVCSLNTMFYFCVFFKICFFLINLINITFSGVTTTSNWPCTGRRPDSPPSTCLSVWSVQVTQAWRTSPVIW